MDDELKYRHMNGEDSQDRPKLHPLASRSFKNCETFCNRLHRSYPVIYQKLVQVTKGFASNQKQSVMSYHNELKKLFGENQDIINDVNKLFYTDARISMDKKGNIYEKGNLELETQRQPFKRQNEMVRDYQDQMVSEPQSKPQFYFSNLQINKEVQSISNHSLLQSRDIKNEIILFEQIRIKAQAYFSTLEEFNTFFTEFMKVISLYNECIISHSDFTDMLSQVIWLDKEIIDQVCIITMCRAQARRQQTALFKPLKDTDFKNAERVTRSYVKMHPGYANTTSTIKSNNSITNQHWVSVPFGSEDYSFQIMRKNTYEEQLFKIEDEKYEFDWITLCYKRVIKLLKELAQTSDIDHQNALVVKILNLKVLQQIYKSSSQDQQEFITLLEKNPQSCANIFLERVELKCQELLDTRNNGAKSSWEIVQMNNFHRSLDHRSFYFKKNEKQYTCSSKFLKEPEDRQKTLVQIYFPECNEEMNLAQKKKNLDDKPNFRMEDIAYYLNSFSQLTTYEPMSKGLKCSILPNPTKENFANLPLFNLLLPNKELVVDTFQYLIHYSQLITSITQNERSWICKFLIQISNGLFDLTINPIDFSKVITNEQLLKTEVLLIEQTIFDANFSYLQSYQGAQTTEEPFQQNRQQKQDSVSPSPEMKEPTQLIPMVSESESQLSKMLTTTPSQTEQDVYTQSNVQDQGVRWLTFLPSLNDDPQLRVLYGPQGVYLFLRYFYTIYQRLEVAKHISFVFESNRKTDKLSNQDKYSLGIKRYMLFKSALFQSLKVKDFKYEDYLRSIYAKQAFLFCTIEKQFQDCCKQLAILQNDKIMESQMNIVFTKNCDESLTQLQNLVDEFNNSSKTEMNYERLFKFDKNISEDMQLAYLTYNMAESQQEKGEKSIYRFAFSPQNDSLSINFIPPQSQLSDKSQLQKTQLNTASYTTTSLTNNRMFLKRNFRKHVPRSRAFNQIEFLLLENAVMKLFEHIREDFLIVRKPNQNKNKLSVPKNHIKNCFQVLEGL